MIPYGLLPDFMRERIESDRKLLEKEKKKTVAKLMRRAIPWDPNFNFKNLYREHPRFPGYVCFKADTFKPERLFDSKPIRFSEKKKPQDIIGPSFLKNGKDGFESTWVYRNLILPRGECLSIASGSRKGEVCFDGDVVVPVLYEFKSWITWDKPFTVWMSLTPFEIFTQRAGIKHCKGRVLIGGLGLGYFLKEVLKKKSVKEVVVVENSKELIDWYGKKMCKDLGVKLVHADVFKYLEKHHQEYDRIALDVFDSYGHNNPKYDHRLFHLHHAYKGPKVPKEKVWCWGAVDLKDRSGYY